VKRIAVLSANLGSYDPHVDWVTQVVPADVTVDVHRFTDATFPLRDKAMTPALQCAVPKMFGWELVPGADYYLWIDASRGLLRSDTVAWFLAQIESAELALFLHPERRTIREEYAFVKARMARPGERYLTSRYAGEWLEAQYAAVCRPWFTDDRLYASTAFVYRPTERVRLMLKDWWFHKTRYLLHDQLALPYVVRDHKVHVRELRDSVYDCIHLPYTRQRHSAVVIA